MYSTLHVILALQHEYSCKTARIKKPRHRFPDGPGMAHTQPGGPRLPDSQDGKKRNRMSRFTFRNVYYHENRMKPEEFNRIIIPMRDGLKRLARRMTGDDDNAEDLVQEVMLKLWSMRQSLDRYDNKKALAATILRNKFNDQWRHWKLENGKEVTEHECGSEQSRIEHIDEIRGQ